jgi:hypothetical protein
MDIYIYEVLYDAVSTAITRLYIKIKVHRDRMGPGGGPAAALSYFFTS